MQNKCRLASGKSTISAFFQNLKLYTSMGIQIIISSYFFSKGITNYFILKVHNTWMFTTYHNYLFVDGRVDYVDFIDINIFSFHEQDEIIQELRYLNGDTI